MTNNLGTFLRDLGKLLHLPAALAVLTLPVILYHRQWFALIPFGVMALSSYDSTSSGLSIALVAFSWFLIPVFGIIVFYGTAINAPQGVFPAVSVFEDFTNSFFEAMSGFTGTGLTMVDDPSQLPFTLQWWRTFMEWIGVLG